MPFIGNKPSAVPLTSADIADSIITSAKITDATIVNADINSSAAIAYSKLSLGTSIVNGDIANSTIALAKLSATGTASASTFLRGDNSWASAGASAGQVIQVLGATDSTQRTTTSTSFVTGSNTLSVTITPSSASNKIAIFVGHYAYNTANTTYYTIYRGATNLGGSNGIAIFGSASGAADSQIFYSFLDSPSTTSATTYQAYMKVVAATTGYMSSTNATSQIIVMEIKG